jgi:tRNA (cytidine56-2'-O)-methyltransferase
MSLVDLIHLPHLSVLRLGHRRERDKRITSHLGLTARAFGADEVLLAGEVDHSALETWNSVSARFGGEFACRHEEKPLSWLRRFAKDAGDGEPGVIVHLTMYGEPWREAIPKIPTDRPTVVVVGGTKVPGEVYRLANHNISVGNQPHSEVAALAIFLESWVGPIDDANRFSGGEIRVIPNAEGKRVVNLEEE